MAAASTIIFIKTEDVHISKDALNVALSSTRFQKENGTDAQDSEEVNLWRDEEEQQMSALSLNGEIEKIS